MGSNMHKSLSTLGFVILCGCQSIGTSGRTLSDVIPVESAESEACSLEPNTQFTADHRLEALEIAALLKRSIRRQEFSSPQQLTTASSPHRAAIVELSEVLQTSAQTVSEPTPSMTPHEPADGFAKPVQLASSTPGRLPHVPDARPIPTPKTVAEQQPVAIQTVNVQTVGHQQPVPQQVGASPATEDLGTLELVPDDVVFATHEVIAGSRLTTHQSPQIAKSDAERKSPPSKLPAAAKATQVVAKKPSVPQFERSPSAAQRNSATSEPYKQSPSKTKAEAIDEIALAIINEHERKAGRDVKLVTDKPSYQLISRLPHPELKDMSAEVRFIKVIHFDETGPIRLSDKDLSTNKRLGDEYWVYCVTECATTPELHMFRNPQKHGLRPITAIIEYELRIDPPSSGDSSVSSGIEVANRKSD